MAKAETDWATHANSPESPPNGARRPCLSPVCIASPSRMSPTTTASRRAQSGAGSQPHDVSFSATQLTEPSTTSYGGAMSSQRLRPPTARSDIASASYRETERNGAGAAISAKRAIVATMTSELRRAVRGAANGSFSPGVSCAVRPSLRRRS